jgi:alkanesulfonate monooxygenase SsuD/methylene tetrahydromethanopterin reductase-like flavin-dependent oxidoreductase (luciferase family)
MFGATLRDHEARYAYAPEWLDIVKLAWSPREDFEFEGGFFRLKGVHAKPKPYGGTRPLIMNAGVSPTGQAFAIRNRDALFSTISRGISFEETVQHVENVKALARQCGRKSTSIRWASLLAGPPPGRQWTIIATASSSTPIGGRSTTSWR